MKKKKIIKYLVLLAAILFAAYIAVHIALSKYISNRVHKAGFDFKVEISSIVLSPFKGGFTLKSINIDDKLLLKNVLIKINFKNFFKNSAVSDEQKEQINENQSAVFNYLKYIKQINIKTAQISFDANGSIKDKAQEILDNLFTPQELYITIDNLSFDGLSDIYFSAFVLRFGENQSSLSSNASVLGQNIKILYEISPGNKNLLDSSLIISANDELEVYTLLKGVINKSSLSLNHSVVIEYLGYKDFRISKAQGSLIGSIEDLNFNLSGEFGSLNLASKNFKDFTVNADIKSSKINENIKADFKADYFYSGGLWKLSLSSNKVSLYSADFGKMDINIVKDANGVYKADYKYGLNNEARLNVIKDSLFDLKLFVGKKYAGGIYINKNLGLIKSDIFNIKAADFPLNPFWGYNSKGTVSITGSVNKQTGGVIYLTVSQFKTDLIAPTNISGIMTMKDEEYVLDISDDLGFISFDARVKDLKFLLADFKFKGVRISKIAQILHYKDNVFWGFMQGNIFYERGKSLSFDIKSSSGVFYGNRFKDFVLKASQNADKIELEEFSMKDLKGANLIKVSGNLFWTDKNQYSNVDIKADGFKIKDFVLSSQIGFLGKLTQSGAIEGVVKDAYIKVNGTLFDSLQADAVISKKSVNISDIDSANGLRADFKYDFEKDLLSATMRFKNSEISNIYEGLTKGTLNMEVKISKAPRLKINANASIRKGVYMKFPFLLDLNASYDNNEILINNLNISGNNAKIKAKGKYAKLNNIEFSFENITKEISDKFVNIKIPIKSGTFFGEGRLYNNYGGDSVQMVLRGSDTVVSNIKINSFTADIDINKSLVSAGSVSAKIAGGEIKMQSAVFDIKSGKYLLNFELINANVGFLNLFGKISVDGNADDNAFSGTVYLDDLWINKYKISKFDMKYRVEGSSVDLSARNSKNAFIFNASAFIDLKPSVTIRNFYLSYANTMFLAEGIIDRNDFRTNIRGSNIDLDIICDILNSPIDMEGKANFIFHSSSSFKDPLINMTLNVVNGSVARVPYDAANISFNVKQNAAELSARISKRNELDVSIDASFPFWLDDSIRDAMRKRAVNIKYDLTNSNLSILKYLSDDFIEPKSGRILLRGSIVGSLEEMSNSGLFTISAGVLSFKEYMPRMKDIDIDILFKDNDIEIRKFSAKSPKGIFKMTGSLNIEDFEIREFNIRAFSEDGGIPIQVPDLSIPSSIISEAVLKDISKAEPTFDISIIGPADKPNIAGKIILENARFNYPSVSGQGADFSFIPPNAQIDIDLITGKNTNFENAYVNARIDGNIKFSGTAAALQKQGIINIQRGVLNYLGAGFDIVSAKIEIIDNMVYVSGESKTDVYSPGGKTPDEVKLSISRSDTQHLNISLTSRDNPSMNSETVLAKVLGISVSGDANNQTDDKKSAAADETNWTGLTDFEIRQQAVRLINSNFVVPLAKTILRRTGIVDNLKVSYVETTASNSSAENGANSSDGSSENAANDETFSETGNNSLANFLYGTKYTVEKNITNQMAIGYSLLFDQLNNELDLRHGIEMTYRLTDNLSLTGNYELQSENLLRQPDRRIMLRHQLRFGGNIPQKQNNNANDAALDNK